VKDDFVILGCDGLWDHCSNQEVVDFVNNRMSDMVIGSQDTQKVADELIQYALKASREKAKDCKSDNISLIIIPLTRAILKPE
jgi:serine/threonine protein phosphatase PrpC